MNHGVLLNANHRMLRAIDAISALRAHFKLGVNFVASVVNRHRIEEVYLLDAAGTIADRSSASIGTNGESSIERC
jgi:protein SCO1